MTMGRFWRLAMVVNEGGGLDTCIWYWSNKYYVNVTLNWRKVNLLDAAFLNVMDVWKVTIIKTLCAFLRPYFLHHLVTVNYNKLKSTNLNSEESMAESSFLVQSSSLSCMWFITASTSSNTWGWWCCASRSTHTKMKGSKYMAVVVSRRRMGLHTLNTWWVEWESVPKEDLLVVNFLYIFQQFKFSLISFLFSISPSLNYIILILLRPPYYLDLEIHHYVIYMICFHAIKY